MNNQQATAGLVLLLTGIALLYLYNSGHLQGMIKGFSSPTQSPLLTPSQSSPSQIVPNSTSPKGGLFVPPTDIGPSSSNPNYGIGMPNNSTSMVPPLYPVPHG
jgi:hypothetical protein